MLFNMNFKIMYMSIFSWLYKENITDAIFLYCKQSKQNKLSKNSVVVIYVCLIKIWAPHQIRKIASCACAGMPGAFSPRRGFAIPTCITARDTRAVMHAGIVNQPSPLKSVVGKTFRRMRNPQFNLSGKRPISIQHSFVSSKYAAV